MDVESGQMGGGLRERIAGLPDRAIILLVFVASIFLASFYGPSQQPLHGDSSYLFYVGYVLSRGLKLYADTTLGYTPLGAMVLSVVIRIANFCNADILITARWVAIVTTALTSVLVYLCAKQITASRWIAALAAVCLSCFGAWAMLACTNLDPKLLLTLFMMVSLAAAYRKYWFLSGVAAAMSFSCWQPAVAVLAGAGLVVLCEPQSRIRNVAMYAAGVLTGLLPAIIYLTWGQEWTVFYYQAYKFKIHRPLRVVQPSLIQVWKAVYPMFRSEILFFSIGAAALLHFMIRWLWKLPALLKRHPVSSDPCTPVFLFTVAWIGISIVNIQGWDDVAPFFPLVALWGAAGIATIFQRIPNNALRAVGAVAILVYMMADTFSYTVSYTTLEQEKQLIHSAASDLSPEGPLLALAAEEVYIFLDRAPYWKFLRLSSTFQSHIKRDVPGGCDGLLRKLKESPPELIVIRPYNPGPCHKIMEVKFLPRYSKSELLVPAKRPFSYEVYKRAEPGSRRKFRRSSAPTSK